MAKYNLPMLGKPRNRTRKLLDGEIECLFYEGVTVVTKYDNKNVCTYEEKYYSWEKALDYYYSQTVSAKLGL